MQYRYNVSWNYFHQYMVRELRKYKRAINLRLAGGSIRFIAKKLHISTSTASVWCRNVELTSSQKSTLAAKTKNAAILKLFAQKRHQDKLDRHNLLFKKAKSSIGNLSSQKLFYTGLALYWAEGFKNINEGRIGFCNSDPKMIKFMLIWFKKILNTSNEDFILRAEFNIEHSERQHEIEEYWSEITNIPLSQFNKPFLQKAKQKRDYSKRGKYYGVLRIRVRKSSLALVKIRGWIEGLSVLLNA